MLAAHADDEHAPAETLREPTQSEQEQSLPAQAATGLDVSEYSVGGGLEAIGSLDPALNTIAEGSSREEKTLGDSGDDSISPLVGAGLSLSKSLTLDDKGDAAGAGVLPSPAGVVLRIPLEAEATAEGGGALSPLSRAVRDKLRKQSTDTADDADAVAEREVDSDQDEGGERGESAEDEALAEAVSALMAGGQVEAQSVDELDQALFWKKDAGGSRGSIGDANRSGASGTDSSPPSSLNGSGEGRHRRARAAVSYKELPINTKCRQGANPWSDAAAREGDAAGGPAVMARPRMRSKSPEVSGGEDGDVDDAGVLAVEGGVAAGFDAREEARRVRLVCYPICHMYMYIYIYAPGALSYDVCVIGSLGVVQRVGAMAKSERVGAAKPLRQAVFRV